MTNRQVTTDADLLSPGEAAKIAGVSPRTLARLADQDKLRLVRPTGSNHRRYLRTEIEEMAKPEQAS